MYVARFYMEFMNMDYLTNGIACYSNKLIEARYSLTPNEQKLVIMMVALISPKDEDFKDYKIRVSDFSNLLDLKNKNIHSQIKDVLCRLTGRTIFIQKEGKSFLVSSWVSSAEYIEKSGVVELSFDKKLKPYLLQLKTEFTKLNLFTAVKFKSWYTIRIYMLLKQYEKIGVREFDLLDFRQKLQVVKKYPRFNSFRQRIVDKAKKELDQKDAQGHFISDISFNFEPIKRGRSVTRLRFIIFQNKHKTFDNHNLVKPEIPALELDSSINTAEQSPALKQLLDFGVAGATAEKIVKKYPTDYLQEKLQLTAEEDRKSPVGFFIKAVENDYKSKKIAQEKIKKEKEKIALEKKKQTELNVLILELGKEYGRIERESFLNSLTAEEMKKLIKSIKQECEENNNAYGLRFMETGLELEHNFHISGYINTRIPDFEEGKHSYITDKMMEKGFHLTS